MNLQAAMLGDRGKLCAPGLMGSIMKRFALFLAALTVLSAPAGAATLNFNGTASAGCALTGGTDGALLLGADMKSWSTATPATIVATNTAASTLTVTRPSSWAASPASTPTTTFDHTATITGTNTASLSGSGDARTAVLTGLGANTVTVSLAATASQPFMPGNYTAQVTVTCAVN